MDINYVQKSRNSKKILRNVDAAFFNDSSERYNRSYFQKKDYYDTNYNVDSKFLTVPENKLSKNDAVQNRSPT